jgi:hypothetical protein
MIIKDYLGTLPVMRPLNMADGSMLATVFGSTRHLLENPALLRMSGTGTQTAQVLELACESPQLRNAVGNVTNMLVEQRADFAAAAHWRIAEIQQRADFVLCHIQ